PPCADAPCLVRVLSDPRNEVHAFLAEQDYWYRLNSTRPQYGFPNTVAFARILPEVLHDRRERDGRENYFFVTARALDVTKYLVRRFVADCTKLGVQPLCLLLYSPRDLRVLRAGRRLDEELVEFLRDNQVPYIDTGRYILTHYLKDDGFEALGVP